MKPGDACAIFLRNDLTLMLQVGDQSLEIKLGPQQALELASSLLSTGLEVGERNAAARSGALQVIANARDDQDAHTAS